MVKCGGYDNSDPKIIPLDVVIKSRLEEKDLVEREIEEVSGITRKPLTQSKWWCNSHGRETTYINEYGNRCCDPRLGGILLPCSVIKKDWTAIEHDKAEIQAGQKVPSGTKPLTQSERMKEYWRNRKSKKE